MENDGVISVVDIYDHEVTIVKEGDGYSFIGKYRDKPKHHFPNPYAALEEAENHLSEIKSYIMIVGGREIKLG